MITQSRGRSHVMRGLPVTPEAEYFIERAVDSIHELEILILLRRSSDRFWRVDEIAAELRMTPARAVLNTPRRTLRNFSGPAPGRGS